MSVFYNGAFIRVKSQKPLTIFAKNLNHICLERVLNTPLQLYLFHALKLKECADKAYQF